MPYLFFIASSTFPNYWTEGFKVFPQSNSPALYAQQAGFGAPSPGDNFVTRHCTLKYSKCQVKSRGICLNFIHKSPTLSAQEEVKTDNRDATIALHTYIISLHDKLTSQICTLTFISYLHTNLHTYITNLQLLIAIVHYLFTFQVYMSGVPFKLVWPTYLAHLHIHLHTNLKMRIHHLHV